MGPLTDFRINPMTSRSQFSLFPERRYRRGPFLHGLEPIAGELTDFADGVQAQIGDFMPFLGKPG